MIAILLVFSLWELVSSTISPNHEIPYEPVNMMIDQNTLTGTYNPNLPLKIYTLGNLISQPDTISLLWFIEDKYLNKKDLLIDLIRCESGFDETKCGDNGRSCGVLQFRKPTYEMFCDGYWLDSQNQIDCGVKMIDKGLGPKEVGWMNCWNLMNLNKYF